MIEPVTRSELDATVGAIMRQARRLQLVWELRPATVTDAGTGRTVQVVMDGDTRPVPVNVDNLAGGGLAAGARVMVMSVPPSGNYVIGVPTESVSVASTVVDTFTTTSLVYVVTGTPTPPLCGVTFIAPPSGRILLSFKGQLVNSTAAQFTIIGFELRTGGVLGSGTVVLAGSDDNCLAVQSTSQFQFGTSLLIESLTPGDSYNTQLGHRVTGGTGTILRRHISVVPA